MAAASLVIVTHHQVLTHMALFAWEVCTWPPEERNLEMPSQLQNSLKDHFRFYV